jgi:hypothetical protein
VGKDFSGIQAALINMSGDSKATGFSAQFGLVNISGNERDIPLGLVNVVKNGILNPAVYYDSYKMLNVSFRSGSKYFYSLFSVGSSRICLGDISFGDDSAGDILVTRAGIGLELPLKKFFLDIDITSGHIFDPANLKQLVTPAEPRQLVTYTLQGRLTLGFKLFKHLGAFVGVSYDYFHPESDKSPVPTTIWENILPKDWSDEQNIHKLGFFAGIQF